MYRKNEQEDLTPQQLAILRRLASAGGTVVRMQTLLRFVLILALGSPAWAHILDPVVTGLDAPVSVTSAPDNSHRLFIVERPGRILVLQPGATQPTLFLDITERVLAGGERGLLGLAFHPQFLLNRRFFVNYTRRPDGATVIAEYRSSATDLNRAELSETTLLIIDQPFANHNGGMLAFGPDGFLYIGTGDGGSGHDPGNRAQDTQNLLGKILRIDVDRAQSTSLPYAIPATNPFVGAADPTDAGRDEIFALGLRNPWRFSFDRATGALYVGDVGQNTREEVSVVSAGGNYGWRVLEGTQCTGLGPAACDGPDFVPPVAEYAHGQERCAVTGGYVYRGTADSLPLGSYVYGDFCSGEIFILEDGASRVLLDTDLAISSFGEDEDGELYVVSLGGSVSRLTSATAEPPKPAALLLEVDTPSDGQAVFGVMLLNGWAFATAADVSLQRVELFIDGVHRGTFLCCAPRADVQAAFPQFPQQNTLNSGWSGLINWGGLSAGQHTIRIEAITSSGAVLTSQTRTVTVVKLVEREFLESMDFSPATFEAAEQDIIARGVLVHDSPNPRSVTLRLRWLPNAQRLGIVDVF